MRNAEHPTPHSNEENSLVQEIISLIMKQQSEEPFYVLDLCVVANLMHKWKRNLPLVHPFYAVKCNPNRAFLTALAALGSNFDCASRSEIESVLALGVSPDRIIYANPCKSRSHIEYAASVGVNLTTFDSVDELVKIQKLHPECDLLIRIKAPDESGSKWPLGSKFGALPEEVSPLLQAAQSARLKVVGVSFHIGSMSHNSQAYKSAITAAKSVFEEAARLGMPPMNVLNIGGGFTADTASFEQATEAVKAAVETHFSDDDRRSLALMAEPGRFFAETAFTLVTNIIGKRLRGELRQYWINEGFFGSLMCVDRKTLADSCIPLKCLPNSSDGENPAALIVCKGGARTYSSTVFGPTCDAIDKVLEGHQLPELEMNDWLVFRNMGAYTSSCCSSFNGFGAAVITYLINCGVSSISTYLC